jgi:hypothetical protein
MRPENEDTIAFRNSRDLEQVGATFVRLGRLLRRHSLLHPYS